MLRFRCWIVPCHDLPHPQPHESRTFWESESPQKATNTVNIYLVLFAHTFSVQWYVIFLLLLFLHICIVLLKVRSSRDIFLSISTIFGMEISTNFRNEKRNLSVFNVFKISHYNFGNRLLINQEEMRVPEISWWKKFLMILVEFSSKQRNSDFCFAEKHNRIGLISPRDWTWSAIKDENLCSSLSGSLHCVHQEL